MNGLEKILNEIKNIMREFYGECIEAENALRALAGPLGVTRAHAIIDIFTEPGFDPQAPYPIIHFMITMAKDISKEKEDAIKRSLQDLNRVITIGYYPAFGCFCYEPRLGQIYLDYRLPVNYDAPDAEIANIRYYFGVLYMELDVLIDLIMYICDHDGNLPEETEYLKYLKAASDVNDFEEKLKFYREMIKEYE